MIPQKAKPRIAWWHRFGPAEQTELFHAMPLVVEKLAKDYEVHFYGFKGHKPVPEKIKKYAIIHEGPFGHRLFFLAAAQPHHHPGQLHEAVSRQQQLRRGKNRSHLRSV